ncbi:MAG: type II toxin-antitoxin system death-on-curing family toxin [Patescibacteria group bacterium]|nr:type II toxin-antitoxin system death-on-curing family toxin [Patescibacteria group bacterium]MCL5224056.1 type II toxin-antitoxin system death-on-curing family toxin [Patescibacteria group bacterium]
MRTHGISIAEVEFTAYSLAKKFMTWDEPIPPFGHRFPNVLESCLKAPFQTFKHKVLYHGLIEKGAFLFYQMVKNRPFENGNKRIAVMTLLTFLYKNGKWLRMENDELYRFAVKVARSNPTDRGRTMEYIRNVIKVFLVNLYIDHRAQLRRRARYIYQDYPRAGSR